MTAVATTMPSPLPRRGLQGFLGAVLAGIVAGAFAWLAIGSHYALMQGLILLVPIPLFMAGLGIGRSDAIVALLVCAAVVTLGTGADNMLVLLIVYMCPVLLLSLLATRYRYDEEGHLFWYPTGRLLTLLVLYPVMVFGLASFLAGPGGIEAVIHNVASGFVEALLKNGANTAPELYTPEVKEMATRKLTAFLPIATLISWIASIAVAGVWSQVALSGNRLALRPAPNLMDLDLPMGLLVLLAIMGLLAVFYQGQIAYFARSVLIPLAIPYLLVGIALVHLWARQRKHKTLWLIAFYIMLFFQWPTVLVAALGVLEPWLHLRARVTAQTGRKFTT